jgi:hypothetical protein
LNVGFIDRLVESRIAEAIERGELDPGPLKGKPIADIDQPRRDGWWAEQFVRRERSRLGREDALEEIRSWKLRFQRAATIGELRLVIEDANRWIGRQNERLVAEDALPLFEFGTVEATWRSLPRQRTPLRADRAAAD